MYNNIKNKQTENYMLNKIETNTPSISTSVDLWGQPKVNPKSLNEAVSQLSSCPPGLKTILASNIDAYTWTSPKCIDEWSAFLKSGALQKSGFFPLPANKWESVSVNIKPDWIDVEISHPIRTGCGGPATYYCTIKKRDDGEVFLEFIEDHFHPIGGSGDYSPA